MDGKNFRLCLPHPVGIILTWGLCSYLTACQTLPTNQRLLNASANLAAANKALPTSPIAQPSKALISQISASKNPSPATLSGYYPLIDSTDAFASRSILTQMSKQSIDIQYYIWHNDESGQLMLKDLYDAANRGVKIRLLLDDLNTNPQLDQQLLTFSDHPNVSVRLINPKLIRSIMPANFLLVTPRYQRRMHNKSMTFDHQLSIIGGRNIGDQYLRNDTANEFADLDILLAGKVVTQIDDSFEQYWQSPLAYDIGDLVKPVNRVTPLHHLVPFLQTLTAIAPFNQQSKLSQSSQLYRGHNRAVIDKQLYHQKIPFRWKPIQFMADDVNKLRNQDDKSTRLVTQLRSHIGTPTQQFSIISSYFVPTELGVLELAKLVKDGVKVNIFTNSYEATDVPIVHSGYSVARKALLQSGVNLYEYKSSADADFRQKKRSLYKTKVSTSLHTKAFAVDDKWAFIGSYNVDPRSADINTELGVLIEDSQLAKSFHAAFDDSMLNISYHVVLSPNQQLTWQTNDDKTNQQLIIYQKEPKISKFNALWVKLFSVLPIKGWL